MAKNRGYQVDTMTEHAYRKSVNGACRDCGGNIDMRCHALARRHAAGRNDNGGPKDAPVNGHTW